MLRPYQVDATNNVQEAWKLNRVAMLVMATGMGKTFTFVHIIAQQGVPACAIAHRSELVEQMSMSLARYGVEHRVIAPENLARKIVGLHTAEFGRSYVRADARVAAASVQTIMARNGTGMDGDTYYQENKDGMFGEYYRESGKWSFVGITHSKTNPKALRGPKQPKGMALDLKRFTQQVELWVGDEGHHYLQDNLWGKAISLFTNPRVKGLLVTATPKRGDNKGLGSQYDGLADVMIKAPSMAWAIKEGFLTDYRVVAPPVNLDFSHLKVSKVTGDYSDKAVADVTRDSKLVVASEHDGKSVMGDVVKHYLKFAKGLLTIVFAPSLDICASLCEQYNAAGVKAVTLRGDTDSAERFRALKAFARREYDVILNVDLFGEGFDCPAVECVQMVRRTESLSLYLQQVGRMLRPSPGKTHGLLIDHVGNFMRHGAPDADHKWSLEPTGNVSGGSSDSIPMRVCLADDCYEPYEAYLKVCPHCDSPPLTGCTNPDDLGCPPYDKTLDACPTCGHMSQQRTVEVMDGDLTELDPSVLVELRGKVEQVDKPIEQAVEEYRQHLISRHVKPMYMGKHIKNFAAKHEAVQAAVVELRESMAWWAGALRSQGLMDAEIFKRFYLEFKHDWYSAQSLPADTMKDLNDSVVVKLAELL
jgi:DNA repair protein RadD